MPMNLTPPFCNGSEARSRLISRLFNNPYTSWSPNSLNLCDRLDSILLCNIHLFVEGVLFEGRAF
jgi:hypothetical protein